MTRKVLTISLVVLIPLIVLISICIYLFIPVHNVCLTSTCVVEAANLMRSIDQSVSPCDDFYGFVCGKWIREKELPDSKAKITKYSDLQDDLDARVKGLITGISPESESREFVRNVKSYYESCYNTTLLEELGDKPLTSRLDRLGGWPLVLKDKWKEVQWDDLYLRLRDEGFTDMSLFYLSIRPDNMNNSRHVLYVNQPFFGLGSRESVLKGEDDPIVKAYKNLMFKSITKLGGSPPEKVRQDVDQLFQFEVLLANNTMPKELRRNQTAIYNKMTVRKLMELAPNIKWLKLLKGFISQTITEVDDIVLYDTNYINVLNEILSRYPNDLIVNLMIWQAIEKTMVLLNEPWQQLKDEFTYVQRGTKSKLPRSKICIKATNSAMNIVIAHLYVKNFFNDVDKEKAQEVLENIVKTFRQSLTETEWMAEQTRKEAIKKLDKMRLFVGYPEELANETLLSEFYQDLNFSPTDYFGNTARYNKWFTDYYFTRYREPVRLYDWRDLSAVAVVNAYYNPVQNMAKIPAGILQGVFFHKDRPNYLNYGGIGFVVGHEMTHGFDDGGRQYDSKGNLRNWWDSDTDRSFKTKSQCFVKQYSNFTINEIGQNLNGINTQGENIADNGGVNKAYKAYQTYAKNMGSEPTLPGLHYTPEQLFWISAGVQWCSKETKENLRLRILSSYHSPNRFRVNGVAMNSPEFSSVFNCPIGSPMNPSQKCKIW